jgi:hypothetical protein
VIRRLRREQRGSVLPASLVLTAAMVALGAATLIAVDRGQQQTATDRVREATFTLADAALGAQAAALTRAWPSTPSPPSTSGGIPDCAVSTTSAPSAPTCPDGRTLVRELDASVPPAQVATQVRDNGGTTDRETYDPTVTPTQPAYDANGDSRLWVRATATTGGRVRSIVALVATTPRAIGFPRHVLIAGRFATANQGAKVIIDTDGEQGGEASELSLRCTDTTSALCAYVERDKGQVSPDTMRFGHLAPRALPDEDYAVLLKSAQAAGTVHATCPPSLTGRVVVIQSGTCLYRNNSIFNSQAAPGMVILERATLKLDDATRFFGVIYGRNDQGSTGFVVETGGNARITGGVYVDFGGGVLAGASGTNLVYAPSALIHAITPGDGAIVRGSWRELPTTTVPAA